MGFFEVNSSSAAKKRGVFNLTPRIEQFFTPPSLSELKIGAVPVELNFVGFSILKKNSFFQREQKKLVFQQSFAPH